MCDFFSITWCVIVIVMQLIVMIEAEFASWLQYRKYDPIVSEVSDGLKCAYRGDVCVRSCFS